MGQTLTATQRVVTGYDLKSSEIAESNTKYFNWKYHMVSSLNTKTLKRMTREFLL